MQFYDATNLTGIAQEIDRLCDSTDVSYSRLSKTAEVNNGMEELAGMIINADGAWQWDDTNQTDHPHGTGNLVSGQTWYSFSAEYLKVESIDILTLGNVYQRIKQVDPDDLHGLSWEEYFGVDASGNPTTGFPTCYDIVSDSIRLDRAPTASNTTLTNGLQVTFKRAPVKFTAVATTAADTTNAGLPSSYDVVLAYMAALPYCMKYHPDRVALYEKKKDELIRNIIAFYSKRNDDYRPIMTMKRISYL